MFRKSFLLLVVVYFVFSISSNVIAQKNDPNGNKDKPNFTGTWVLDPKKSSEEGSSWPERSKRCSFTMNIIHNDPELIMVSESVCNFASTKVGDPEVTKSSVTYYTNSRGEVYKDHRSKTCWKGEKIIIIREIEQPQNFARMNMVTETVLSLRKNKLIETTNFRNKEGFLTIATHVYDLKL